MRWGWCVVGRALAAPTALTIVSVVQRWWLVQSACWCSDRQSLHVCMCRIYFCIPCQVSILTLFSSVTWRSSAVGRVPECHEEGI